MCLYIDIFTFTGQVRMLPEWKLGRIFCSASNPPSLANIYLILAILGKTLFNIKSPSQNSIFTRVGSSFGVSLNGNGRSWSVVCPRFCFTIYHPVCSNPGECPYSSRYFHVNSLGLVLILSRGLFLAGIPLSFEWLKEPQLLEGSDIQPSDSMGATVRTCELRKDSL